MSSLSQKWKAVEPGTKTAVMIIILLVVALIVLIIIKRVVDCNKRKASSDSGSSDSRHLTNAAKVVPVQLDNGSEHKVEKAAATGSVGVVQSTCGGGNCGDQSASSHVAHRGHPNQVHPQHAPVHVPPQRFVAPVRNATVQKQETPEVEEDEEPEAEVKSERRVRFASKNDDE